MNVWEREAKIRKEHDLILLDRFIEMRMRHNTANSLSQYQGIGATKWMFIRAAMSLQDGKNVLLVFPEYSIPNFNLRMVTELTDLAVVDMQVGKFTLENGAWVLVTSEWVVAKSESFVVFNDDEWKQRTIRRARGPFDMQREVRTVGGRSFAYAEDDEFLFELAPAEFMNVPEDAIEAVKWAPMSIKRIDSRLLDDEDPPF